ncbi:MAG: helix-turn-helix domain-containing protein [Heliobacteriaceae bacterium]|jgi:transcriptional regulator with XRE-family HTH domain|nr:helix-turn-helix domain-containing protein [Heliobacteriaceae bacterium]
MNFKQAFGLQLKRTRQLRDFTQEKLAELVNIHPRQISKLETGEHFPSWSTLGNLCIALNAQPCELFSFEFGNSYESMVCNYKATIRGNVIYLHENRGSIPFSYSELEEEMFVMAKNIKRSVVVQYMNSDGAFAKIIEYFPNKTYKIIDKDKEAEIQILLNKIKELSQNGQYLKFFKLAISAVEDSEDLDKLSAFIDGMKLAGKK